MPDGPSTDNWVGEWFVPVIGNNYTVPDNAGNHGSWKGKVGFCDNRRASGFGMHWAHLVCGEGANFQEGWVRTCYLVPFYYTMRRD